MNVFSNLKQCLLVLFFTNTLVCGMDIANKSVVRLYPLSGLRTTKNLKLQYIMQYITIPILVYLAFLCTIPLKMHFVEPTDYLKNLLQKPNLFRKYGYFRN